MRAWYNNPAVCGVVGISLAIMAVFGCGSSPETKTSAVGPPSAGATLEHETWDVVFLSGERVGHIHTTVFREPRDSGDILRIEQEEALALRSNNNRIDTQTTMTSLETVGGQLLEFTSLLPQGDTPMETVGRVVGDELQLEVGAGKQKTEASLPWAPEFGGPYRVNGSLESDPLEPGETRTLRYLDVATNQLATSILTAADYEETEMTAGVRRLLRVEAETSIGGHTIKSTLWTDEKGDICKTRVPEMFDYTAIRATKDEALQKVTQIDFDLGKRSAVPVARTLSTPHKTKRIVYRVHLDSADPVKVFDSCLTQRVVPEDEHTALVTVYAVRPGETSGNPDAQPEGTTEADLEPNNLIQSDDPTVVFLAQQAAGEIKDPWEAAVALEKSVHTKMTSLGISSAFATAGQVARELKGDCTEHAVLLAALARARGIPARVAIGLVYYRREFLYHMWDEVYVDGNWIPLDATLGQGGIGAAHLRITDSNLQGASPNAAFLPVTEVIGQLKIEIVEVE